MYPTEGLVIFTIVEERAGKLGLIAYKPYKEYEVHNVDKEDLYKEMNQLAGVFNNHLHLGILFEVE